MVKVFYDKTDEGPKLGLPIGTLLRCRPTKGDVGMEIEVEASSQLLKDNHELLATGWTYHHDGSLRGYDNAEYVLTKPVDFDKVPEALAALWGKFDKYKSKLDDSNRTSVHVHLNCQQFHLNRVTAFCALYFCFEEVLTEWCGEHRVGNLFCLRAKDAPAIVSQMKRFIRSDGQSELRDGLHYSGLNVQALAKFGSIEVRTLRGVKDPAIILQWVNILERLYKLSAEYLDPRDVCGAFSQGGPLAFFDNMLGDMGPTVREGISFNDDRILESMYEGIRMAQDLCYCRDWGVFKPIDLKDDPFGRDPLKVMSAVAGLNKYPPPSSHSLSTYQLATAPIKKKSLFAQVYGHSSPNQPSTQNPFGDPDAPAPMPSDTYGEEMPEGPIDFNEDFDPEDD